MKKYYFVVFQWRRLSPHFGVLKVKNMVIDFHPLDWLQETRERQEKIVEEQEKSTEPIPSWQRHYYEEYHILFYVEISEELYKKHEELGM